MHRFIHQNHLTRFDESFEYEYLFESAVDSIHCNDYVDLEREQLHTLLQSYFDGEISDFMNKVYDNEPLDVAKVLNEYQPTSLLEAKLMECFREGLPFISENNIMTYEYNPDMDNLPEDYPPVTLDRMVRYLYALDDFVTNELEYMNNQYLQETYPLQPVSYAIFCPGSKLFVPGDYPERFSEWFLKMVNITKEITGNE